MTTPKFDPPTPNKSKQTAGVRISGQIYFTPYERSQMQQGLRFRLECRIIGDDASAGASEGADTTSNVRYVFPFRYYPDTTPGNPESYAFADTLGLSVLNEDYGLDELFARVTLVNLSNGSRIHAHSNRVQGDYSTVGPS